MVKSGAALWLKLVRASMMALIFFTVAWAGVLCAKAVI
jgi:hypothetical protein